jgi:hypothetical protein
MTSETVAHINAIVDDAFIDHTIARQFTCMLSLQTSARMCVHAVLAPLVCVETVPSALVSIETVLCMSSIVRVACTNIALRASTHVSTRPATASACPTKTSSSASAAEASSGVSRLGSAPAAGFPATSLMFVARGND